MCLKTNSDQKLGSGAPPASPKSPKKLNLSPALTAAISTILACAFVALFKASPNWPLIGGRAHLFIFTIPMLALIFLTSFRSFRRVNAYVAEHITDHSFIKQLAEKKISSFITAASISIVLSASMATFTYVMSWRDFPIVAGGFAVVAWLIYAFNFKNYLKQAVAEISKGYIAVGAASMVMVLAYMATTIFGGSVELDPLSPALIEHVRETVNHPNYSFESIARTIAFLNLNILSLGNLESFSRSLVVALVLVTTSSVPFLSLSLFMRSLHEVTLGLLSDRRISEQKDGM